jgi:hypothetical protein
MATVDLACHKRERVEPLIGRTELVRSVLDGITVAHKTYERWSGGDWLCDAGVEGFLVASIAGRLFDRVEANCAGGHVILETPMCDIVPLSQPGDSAARPFDAELRPSGRVDVSVWRDIHTVEAVVEVKRGWFAEKCWDDFVRLSASVALGLRHGDGNPSLGCLAMYLTWRPTGRVESVDAKLKAIVSDLDAWSQASQYLHPELRDATEWTIERGPKIPYEGPDKRFKDMVALGACVVITPRKTDRSQ